MSHSPPADHAGKPRACSVHSVSTTAGDEASRSKRKGSRAKHSWEYVPVDPAEDEAPPPNASRLQKELFSSFTNTFLSGHGRRTRAAAAHASQHLHEHSGSDLSVSSHSHPASETGFSTTTTSSSTTTSAASPASSPAPPSAPSASRKRKDSAAPTSDSHRKRAGPPTPAPSAASDPAVPSTASNAAAALSLPASSPPPHHAPAVQRAQSVQRDRSAASTLPSRAAADGSQAKDSGKRKSSVFDDATNKTKAHRTPDSKPSAVPDPFDASRKRKLSPAADKMAPKVKKAKTTSTATDSTKSAKAAAIQKRDSLLQEDVYAQGLPWTNDAPNQANGHHHHSSNARGPYKQQQQQQQHRNNSTYYYSPTRAQLADQLEEITHRGIAGGPANYSSLREYRAACAAEAAWQERDQEVVERMLDNPRVIEVLKRLRVLNAEIEAERTSGKGAGKGHVKGGRKRKVTDDLMDGD
ncbi:hypothetical protein MPH_11471 [Macrophomina phaseolina MS6]|uniref:Uncharacterized protein n=1 Tax=Macrophomina phaseolina (strain MS6) TaxID=1126212 RepID=K2QNE6_MACPH|nr:hypothetical protein MPH_11471 [Macrophomina phaseolina MS6]